MVLSIKVLPNREREALERKDGAPTFTGESDIPVCATISFRQCVPNGSRIFVLMDVIQSDFMCQVALVWCKLVWFGGRGRQLERFKAWAKKYTTEKQK